MLIRILMALHIIVFTWIFFRGARLGRYGLLFAGFIVADTYALWLTW